MSSFRCEVFIPQVIFWKNLVWFPRKEEGRGLELVQIGVPREGSAKPTGRKGSLLD